MSKKTHSMTNCHSKWKIKKSTHTTTEQNKTRTWKYKNQILKNHHFEFRSIYRSFFSFQRWLPLAVIKFYCDFRVYFAGTEIVEWNANIIARSIRIQYSWMHACLQWAEWNKRRTHQYEHMKYFFSLLFVSCCLIAFSFSLTLSLSVHIRWRYYRNIKAEPRMRYVCALTLHLYILYGSEEDGKNSVHVSRIGLLLCACEYVMVWPRFLLDQSETSWTEEKNCLK